MKKIKTEDAVGHILCHDITMIVKDVTKGAAFRKGHVVTEEDIPVLQSIGKNHLFVWEKQEGMLHENDAAEILYKICAGENMGRTEVREGKIELIADCDGLLVIDVDRLRKLNSLGEIMIASRHSHFPVKKGDKLAGTRVIPLVISEEKMKRVVELAGDKPLLTLLPFKPLKVGIITTGNEVFYGKIKDTFTPVLEQKLSEFGGFVISHALLPDSPQQITNEIKNMIENGAEMVLCTGGMSVDPDDLTPLAIKNTGAEIISYGAPVLPGAMSLIAYYCKGDEKAEIPIVGLPGCVMYASRTIFDIILPRIMAGLRITSEELAGLGNGGMCLNCEVCTYPNCGFGKGV